MKKLIGAVLLLLTLSAYSQNDKNDKVKAPKIVSNLTPEKAFSAGDIELKLVEVMEDSRCPTGVQCMWQGEATVMVDIMKDGKKIETKKLTFDGDTKEVYNSETVKIKAVNLMPYPKEGSKIKPKEYYMQLEVENL